MERSRIVTIIGIFFLFVVLLLVFSSMSSAGDIIVDDDGGGDYLFIQDAINASIDGDNIYVWNGTYNEEIVVNKSVSIIGNSTSDTFVVGTNTSGHNTIFVSASEVNISGLNISGNDQSNGNGVLIEKFNVSVSDCYFKYITRGVRWYNSSFTGTSAQRNVNLTIDNCTFDNPNGDSVNVWYGIGFTVNNSLFINSDHWHGCLFVSSRDYGQEITVSNSTFTGCHLAIYAEGLLNNSVFKHNYFEDCTNAIYLLDPWYVKIWNNTIINSVNDGIYIAGGATYKSDIKNVTINDNDITRDDTNWDCVYISDDGTNLAIYNNTVTSADYGFYIKYATNMEIYNNTAYNNNMGMFLLYSITDSNVYNNHVHNNSIGGIELYSNCDNVTFTGNNIRDNNVNGGIILFSVTNVVIDNNILHNNHFRNIWFENFHTTSDNIRISNNTISGEGNADYGIEVWNQAHNLTIENNTITGNTQGGFYMSPGSAYYANNLTIRNNQFIDNGEHEILVVYSDDVNIYSNTITKSSLSAFDGIKFEELCDNNSIYDNTIQNHSHGIRLRGTSNYPITDSIIYNNTVIDNTYGIYTEYCANDTIYNNYFDNTNNVYSDATDTNIRWNITKTLGTNIINGSYLGGNYWSDYTGIDADGDGLGDTEYTISSGDQHPLVYTLLADFYYTPKTPGVDERISFLDRSLGTGIIMYHWNFGDGYTSVGKTVYHSYDEPRRYKVTLTVTNDRGMSDSCFEYITVSEREFSIVFPRPGGLPYSVPEMYQLLGVDQIPKCDAELTIVFLDTGYTPRVYNNTDLSRIEGVGDPVHGSVFDRQGHGTWVSYALMYILQEKLPNSKLVSYRLFDKDGFCTMQMVMDAFDYIETLKPDIVSFSGGGLGNPDDALSKKVESLRGQGVIVVVAAGNSGPNPSTILSPACSRGAMAVGAVDPLRSIFDLSDDVVTPWSSRGPVPDVSPKPDYTSPGESIIGPWLVGERTVSGTSMATPLFAGGIAVIMGSNSMVLSIVDLLYFWDGGIKQGILDSGVESTVFTKGDADDYGYGIPMFEDASGWVFWHCIFLIIVWLMVLVVSIAIVYYVYKKYYSEGKHKKRKETTF